MKGEVLGEGLDSQVIMTLFHILCRHVGKSLNWAAADLLFYKAFHFYLCKAVLLSFNWYKITAQKTSKSESETAVKKKKKHCAVFKSLFGMRFYLLCMNVFFFIRKIFGYLHSSSPLKWWKFACLHLREGCFNACSKILTFESWQEYARAYQENFWRSGLCLPSSVDKFAKCYKTVFIRVSVSCKKTQKNPAKNWQTEHQSGPDELVEYVDSC